MACLSSASASMTLGRFPSARALTPGHPTQPDSPMARAAAKGLGVTSRPRASLRLGTRREAQEARVWLR